MLAELRTGPWVHAKVGNLRLSKLSPKGGDSLPQSKHTNPEVLGRKGRGKCRHFECTSVLGFFPNLLKLIWLRPAGHQKEKMPSIQFQASSRIY